MSFVSELKRRKVFQVAAVYLVVAWLIMQVVDVVNEPLRLPEWFATVAILIVAIGFPIALILSWAFDLTPEGVVRDQGTNVAVQSGGRRIEYVFTGLLVVAVATLLYREFSPPGGEVEVAGVLPNSIAVLPFENLSPDPDQEYIAAGFHESTLNQLAKIRDLTVIARTSVLQYKDDPPPIPEIAQALNVEMILEGSLRYANDRVLITVQLIDGNTGAHIWSDEYNRDLTDIFGIQGEIAEKIAMALEVELLPSEQESIEKPLTESPDALKAYYRAMVIIGEGESAFGVSALPGTRAAIQSYLDEALELDPRFALAHAWKAYIYAWARNFDPFVQENWLDQKSELDRLVAEHADAALALDPSIGLAHAARAFMHINNWRGESAQVEADQALRLNPNDPTVHLLYSNLKSLQDQPGEAVRHSERAVELDPNGTQAIMYVGDALHAAGRHAEASEVAQECLAIDPAQQGCYIVFARAEVARGNYEAALDALRLTDQLLPDGTPVLHSELVYAYGLLGQPEDAQRVFEELRGFATDQYVDPSIWAWAYMGVGDYDEALRQLHTAAENLELLQLPWVALFIRDNTWSDPILEQSEWVEMRSRLGFRE